MKLYPLNNERNRAAAIEAIRQTDLNAGQEVQIKKHRGGRSLAQNRLYHMWLKIISDETGYTTTELHNELRMKFLGWEMFETKMDKDNAYMIIKSTTDLNTKEFSEYLNEIDRMMASEVGISLPHPEDMYYEAMGYGRTYQNPENT